MNTEQTRSTDASRTKIEWADYTLNFWRGCAKVSEACRNCYAEGIARRLWSANVGWGQHGKRELRYGSAQRKLAQIVRTARRTGQRPRVFVNSVSDTFEDHFAIGKIQQSALLLMEHTKEVDFLLLTKRPENIIPMVPYEWMREEPGSWPKHIWIGTTVENQATADERIPLLLKVPAAVRFLSCEPLLGPVKISQLEPEYDADGKSPTWPPKKPMPRPGDVALSHKDWPDDLDFWRFKFSGVHWVIAGGESGRGARPMHPDWARSLRDQCAAAGVPFFFKQWGEWAPGECVGDEDRLRCATWQGEGWDYSFQTEKQSESCHADDSPDVYRIGKKAAGRLLDGVEHNAIPGQAV